MAGVSSKQFYCTCHFFPPVTFIFVMTICQQTFGRTNSLTRQLREKHSQNPIGTKCRFCTKTFSSEEHYRHHLRTNSTQPSVAKLPVSRLLKQDLQAQILPTTTPTELPCPTKGRQSKRAICNSIFPGRGH